MKKISLSKLVTLRNVVVVILLVLAGSTYFLYGQNRSLSGELSQLKKDPQEVSKEEVLALTEQISKLVALPSGEEPVVATVTDKEKLKDQPIFEKTENGDKILIYGSAKKAYIYRPSSNIIIDVLPVNLGDDTAGIPGVDEKNPLRLALYNGTATAGLTNDLEKRISDQKILGVSVTAKANASRDYDKTVVVDLTGKRSEQAVALAKMLNGEVATQAGEARPNADILVIVGKNFK